MCSPDGWTTVQKRGRQKKTNNKAANGGIVSGASSRCSSVASASASASATTVKRPRKPSGEEAAVSPRPVPVGANYADGGEKAPTKLCPKARAADKDKGGIARAAVAPLKTVNERAGRKDLVRQVLVPQAPIRVAAAVSSPGYASPVRRRGRNNISESESSFCSVVTSDCLLRPPPKHDKWKNHFFNGDDRHAAEITKKRLQGNKELDVNRHTMFSHRFGGDGEPDVSFLKPDRTSEGVEVVVSARPVRMVDVYRSDMDDVITVCKSYVVFCHAVDELDGERKWHFDRVLWFNYNQSKTGQWIKDSGFYKTLRCEESYAKESCTMSKEQCFYAHADEKQRQYKKMSAVIKKNKNFKRDETTVSQRPGASADMELTATIDMRTRIPLAL